MKKIYEIYLTKKYVTKNEWDNFIKSISYYNGILRKWKIIIKNNNNRIDYYLISNKSLPITINNLSSFLLKPSDNLSSIKHNKTKLYFKLDINFINLINDNEVKEDRKLIYTELSFRKFYEDKISSKSKFYVSKNNIIYKYNIIFNIPVNILSINFEVNQRYYLKDTGSYLDINKILHLLNTDENKSLLKVDTFPYLQGNFYLDHNNFNINKHSIIIGSSGCGKSIFICKLIENIYKQNKINNNYKVIVIDPHASLENDIGGIGKIIDFKNSYSSINLFNNNSNDITANCEILLDLMKTLLDNQYNSKLERVLRHSIYLLLSINNFNFITLKKLLLDIEYRNKIIKQENQIIPINIINFFLTEFNELKTKSYIEAISPIISFIDEMTLLPVFNKNDIKENLNSTLENNFLTIFSLNKLTLGEKITKTISGLLLNQLFNNVQTRKKDKHIILIIDEIALIENPIIPRLLSEARKYNLSLILAGQYFNQISTSLKNSIFANAINYFIFRVSKIDASLLVDNINMKIPLDNSKENKIKLLTNLNNRQCITRIESNDILMPAFKASTLNFKSIPRIKDIEKQDTINIDNNQNKINEFDIDYDIKLNDILISNSKNKKGDNNEL